MEKTLSYEADDGWSRRTRLAAADQKGNSSGAIPSTFARYLGSSFFRSLMTAASLRKEIAARASMSFATGRKEQILCELNNLAPLKILTWLYSVLISIIHGKIR